MSADCDVIIICVPTPLSTHREPDMSYVTSTAETIAAHLRTGQLVTLEIDNVSRNNARDHQADSRGDRTASEADFYLGFSPEREDPGNRDFSTVSIPKIVAVDGPEADAAMGRSALLSCTGRRRLVLRVAEATKIIENVYRSVNIAMVN